MRLFSQSTSSHVRARCSEGQRSPPYRLNANSSRHWASGQASRTAWASARVTKYDRSGFGREVDFRSENRFSVINRFRTAAVKNCFAICTCLRTEFSARPSDIMLIRQSSASPGVIDRKSRSAPKCSINRRLVALNLMRVRCFRSVRPSGNVLVDKPLQRCPLGRLDQTHRRQLVPHHVIQRGDPPGRVSVHWLPADDCRIECFDTDLEVVSDPL